MLECDLCSKKYKSDGWLKKHIQTKHSSMEVGMGQSKQNSTRNGTLFLYLSRYLLDRILFYFSDEGFYKMFLAKPSILKDKDDLKNRLRDKYQLCIDCFVPTSFQDEEKDFICSWCSKHDGRITKKRAKEEFLFNENEIDRIEHNLARNPRFRCASPMKLFTISVLMKEVENKYPNLTDFAAKKHHRVLRRLRLDDLKKKRVQKAVELREKRRRDLIQALREVGMVMRSDSKLCQGYIYGTLDSAWSLEDVVSMCQEMRWLYEHTPYPDELNQRVHDSAREYRSYKSNDWGYCWNRSYEEEEPFVRRDILKKYPKPEKFPWNPRDGESLQIPIGQIPPTPPLPR